MKAPYQLFKDLAPAVESALRGSIDRFGVLVPVAISEAKADRWAS